MEQALCAMFGVRERTCQRCRQKKRMAAGVRICLACKEQQQAEANRANQRRRRRRERAKRRIEAGFLKRTGPLFLVDNHATCAHCGANFEAKRTTARYCSTRCRVAAHRAKQS
jgi:hypothetical protein